MALKIFHFDSHGYGIFYMVLAETVEEAVEAVRTKAKQQDTENNLLGISDYYKKEAEELIVNKKNPITYERGEVFQGEWS